MDAIRRWPAWRKKSIKNGLMIKTEPVYCKWVCHKMAAVLIIIIWPGMSYCDTHRWFKRGEIEKEGLARKILCPPLNFRTIQGGFAGF